MSTRTLGWRPTACHGYDQTLGASRVGVGVYFKWMLGLNHVILAASPGRTRLAILGQYHLGKADQDVWNYPQLSRWRAGAGAGRLHPGLHPDGRSLSRAGLRQLGLSLPSHQEGADQPQLPAHLAVIWHLQLPGKEAGESRKGIAGASPPTGRAKASSAQPRRTRDPRGQ